MPSTEMLGKWIVITSKTLTEWQRVSNTVDNALRVGGETGMDMLLNIIPEWNEAVDEANAALEVCWELGNRGLRSEALGWHAKGFLDGVEKLAPDRPGWTAWNDALLARGVTPPVIDVDTKDAVEKFIEEMQLKDLRGSSVTDHLRDLRRNVLCRGDFGERLVTIERLRDLDPGRESWNAMANPLRERRKSSVAPDLHAAMESGDQNRIASVLQAVRHAKLEEFFSGADGQMLQAAKAVLALPKLAAELSKMTEKSTRMIGEIKACALGESHRGLLKQFQPIARELRSQKNKVGALLKTCVDHEGTRGLVSAADIARLLKEASVLEEEIKRVFSQHEKLAALQKEFRPVLMKANDLVSKKPNKGGGWDVYKKQARKWLSAAEALEFEFERFCELVDQALPAGVEQAFTRLQAAAGEVHAEVKNIQQTEKMVLFGTLSLVGIVMLGGLATGLVVWAF